MKKSAQTPPLTHTQQKALLVLQEHADRYPTLPTMTPGSISLRMPTVKSLEAIGLVDVQCRTNTTQTQSSWGSSRGVATTDCFVQINEAGRKALRRELRAAELIVAIKPGPFGIGSGLSHALNVKRSGFARGGGGSETGPGSELPRKGKKYNGSFHGDDDGRWELGGYLSSGWRWNAAMSLSSKNEWRHLSVEGATEHHAGFRKALREMVHAYPELIDFVVSFDGPDIPVAKLLEGASNTRGPDWARITFYHGTSSKAAERILREGLRPRDETAASAAYGASASAKEGLSDAVYLTTQVGMARFAAHDAARAHGGEPVVLEIRGIDGAKLIPDEDSGERDPEASLARIGSVAYRGSIPASKIRIAMVLDKSGWQERPAATGGGGGAKAHKAICDQCGKKVGERVEGFPLREKDLRVRKILFRDRGGMPEPGTIRTCPPCTQAGYPWLLAEDSDDASFYTKGPHGRLVMGVDE